MEAGEWEACPVPVGDKPVGVFDQACSDGHCGGRRRAQSEISHRWEPSIRILDQPAGGGVVAD